MASYKNPYNNQQNQAIDSIGRSLAEIFMPNSASNIAANNYNRQGQRYAQLAESSRLSDIEQNIKNQKAIREQEEMEYLATNPQLLSLFSSQLGANGRLGEILARQLAEKDPTLITNRFATNQAAGMSPEQAQDYARRESFNRGQLPTANFAFNENAADRINERAIEKQIAAYQGKADTRMDIDNNNARNRAEEGARSRADRAAQAELDRGFRGEQAALDRGFRGDQAELDRNATDNRAANKNAFDRSKYTVQDRKNENELLNVLAPLNASDVGIPVEFTGDSEVDTAMHSFIQNQYASQYADARAKGLTPSQADRVALNGLARASVGKAKEYSTGVFGFGNSTQVPLYILQELRQQIRQDPDYGKGLAQQLLGKFEIKGELQQQIIDDLIATSK